MGLFRFLARMTIGLLFVGHGAQKLFGWFGGGGPEGTGKFFEQAGLPPGRRYAVTAGAAEAGGGLLFAMGAATPLAATAISGVMITAIKNVHWERGIWSTAGGYEYNLVLLAAVFGLTENGPGKWSIDGALGKSRWGTLLGARGARRRSGRVGRGASGSRARGAAGGQAAGGRRGTRHRGRVAGGTRRHG